MRASSRLAFTPSGFKKFTRANGAKRRRAILCIRKVLSSFPSPCLDLNFGPATQGRFFFELERFQALELPRLVSSPRVYVQFVSSLYVDMEITAAADGCPSEQPLCKRGWDGCLCSHDIERERKKQ